MAERFWRRIIALVFAAGFTLAWPASLFGQSDGVEAAALEAKPERKPWDYQDTSYALTQYEVEKFSELLDLSPDQHETMMAMFVEVRRRVFEAEQPVHEAREEFLAFSRDGMAALRADGDTRTQQRYLQFQADFDVLHGVVRDREQEFHRFQHGLGEVFFEDLELLLTPDQVGRIDGMIRWRHRFRYLRDGHLPYQQFSVATIARDLDLAVDPQKVEGTAAPALEDIYLQYEIELDGLLLQRRGIRKPSEAKERGAPEEVAAHRDWQKRIGAINLRMVSMQKKYIRQIAYLVPVEAAREFEDRCRKLAYPFVLSEPEGKADVQALLDLPGVDEELRERLMAAWSKYQSSRERINERWVRALDALIADERPHILAANSPGFYIGDTQDPDFMQGECWKLATERRALDEAWLGQLRMFREGIESSKFPADDED